MQEHDRFPGESVNVEPFIDVLVDGKKWSFGPDDFDVEPPERFRQRLWHQARYRGITLATKTGRDGRVYAQLAEEYRKWQQIAVEVYE